MEGWADGGWLGGYGWLDGRGAWMDVGGWMDGGRLDGCGCPNPGIKPTSPTIAGGFFTAEPPGKPNKT